MLLRMITDAFDVKKETERSRENPWEEVGLPVYIFFLQFPGWQSDRIKARLVAEVTWRAEELPNTPPPSAPTGPYICASHHPNAQIR